MQRPSRSWQLELVSAPRKLPTHQARGFDNPGPLVGYPGNQALFRSRSGNLLRPGDRALIPYHPDVLQKAFLFKIDAANMLANMGMGIGPLIAKGPGATMSSKEGIAWLVESWVNLAGGAGTSSPTWCAGSVRRWRYRL